jgi:hypothetical protein
MFDDKTTILYLSDNWRNIVGAANVAFWADRFVQSMKQYSANDKYNPVYIYGSLQTDLSGRIYLEPSRFSNLNYN